MKGEFIIKAIGVVMVVAVVLILLTIESGNCNGVLVRGLFWFECIE